MEFPYSRNPSFPGSSHSTKIASSITSMFKDARNSIEQDINRIVIGLNKKKSEMFASIGKLEKEFVGNYQKKRSEIDKLKCLQKQTGELTENTLSSMQNTISRELEQGVKQLNLEIGNIKKPEYQININWGICIATLLSQITKSKLDISPKKEKRHPQPNTPAPTFKVEAA